MSTNASAARTETFRRHLLGRGIDSEILGAAEKLPTPVLEKSAC